MCVGGGGGEGVERGGAGEGERMTPKQYPKLCQFRVEVKYKNATIYTMKTMW